MNKSMQVRRSFLLVGGLTLVAITAYAGVEQSMAPFGTFYGHNAGAVNTGESNSFFGFDAGASNETGQFNVFIGRDAGKLNVEGAASTIIGFEAGLNNNDAFNTFVGWQAGKNTSMNTVGVLDGSRNVFVGSAAGQANTAGRNNSFLGHQAGRKNTTGDSNSFFGLSAGDDNNTGSSNSFFGQNAGAQNISGGFNAFFGGLAGFSNTTGNANSIFGDRADLMDGISNASALGFRAYVAQDNAMVLGSIPGVNNATGYIDVGIGTSTPQAPLHIQRTTSGATEMFRFTNTGGSFITWEKTTGNQKWFFTHEDAAQGRFIIDHQDNGGLDGPEMALDIDGNLEINGTLTEMSDANAKQDIEELPGQLVLAKLEQVPVSQWRYKSSPESRHVGPMAQDFHAAFGLGADDKHISPRDMAGVALAAIKALRDENEHLKTELAEKDVEIAKLAMADVQKDAEIATQQRQISDLQVGLKQALRAVDGMKARLEAVEAANSLVQASMH